ncbi:MAG: pantoate--beta-alanine ligase [Solidesulfovibrio magneticus str. Maddingley MBC34]|uniref:Pantothenate synthetase n=1 Tax=Solidesulfovibrio magneticus str. Maddingley MBC34 TaxID=1206767 RepID=K6H8B3_9BACT|nr:MAG: pantoate--beta-alanine ligase [Solidesulfovibrio magneticus str. Maddingley MBC34]
MEIIKEPSALRELAGQWTRQGRTVGFVPTMGYLHAGHESLMHLARGRAETVVASVFVNPTQFGPGEDLDAYPRDLDRDAAMAKAAGVDVLFAPSPEAMYEPAAATWVEVPTLARHLCGASRPTHFRGVCTVVSKLFLLVRPALAVFGQKDWQQLAILRRMNADLGFGVEIVGGPIVREADGLALSSRNVRLTPEERGQAPGINQGLALAEAMVRDGEADAGRILDAVRAHYAAHVPLGEIDYLSCVDPDSLETLETIDRPALFATAVRFSAVRLIDNRLAATVSR